jgi:aryl-alcohol dehydrogenase-like predicted oxidoreductase
LQIEYSLAQRDPERDLIPMAPAFDMGITAWFRWPAAFSAGSMVRRPKANLPPLATAAKAIRRMKAGCASEKQ